MSPHLTSETSAERTPPNQALRSLIVQAVFREGTLDADGALKAIEFAQGIPLTKFSLEGGPQEIAAALERAPAQMLTFLVNVMLSINAFCALSWGKKDQWHSLVEALVIEAPEGDKSLLNKQFLSALPGAKTRQAKVDLLIATPTLSALLLIRWLRSDLLYQKVDDHLQQIVSNRPTTTPS